MQFLFELNVWNDFRIYLLCFEHEASMIKKILTILIKQPRKYFIVMTFYCPERGRREGQTEEQGHDHYLNCICTAILLTFLFRAFCSASCKAFEGRVT